MFNTIRATAFAIAATLAIGAGAAQAQDSQTLTRTVKFNDLDLHTQAGADTLRHRVAIAARAVCGTPELLGSTGFANYEACVSQATQQASHRADAMIASVRSGARYASTGANG